MVLFRIRRKNTYNTSNVIITISAPNQNTQSKMLSANSFFSYLSLFHQLWRDFVDGYARSVHLPIGRVYFWNSFFCESVFLLSCRFCGTFKVWWEKTQRKTSNNVLFFIYLLCLALGSKRWRLKSEKRGNDYKQNVSTAPKVQAKIISCWFLCVYGWIYLARVRTQCILETFLACENAMKCRKKVGA